MHEQVLNYQCEVLQKQAQYSGSYLRVHDPHNLRYTPWRLHQMLLRVLAGGNFSIRWIGTHPHAHILSLLYCLLSGCLSPHCQPGVFLQLKFNLYQQSKQVLSISEQKIFVEHLALIQDSKNISEFLKKSSYLQSIFTKLFQSRCSGISKPKYHHASSSGSKPMWIQELENCVSMFPFTYFQIIADNCFNLIINNNHSFYIVQEKQCYFVVEEGIGKLGDLSCWNLDADGVGINMARKTVGQAPNSYYQGVRKGSSVINSKQSADEESRNTKDILSRDQSGPQEKWSAECIDQKKFAATQPIGQLKNGNSTSSYIKLQKNTKLLQRCSIQKSNEAISSQKNLLSKIDFGDLRTSVKYTLKTTKNCSPRKISWDKERNREKSGGKRYKAEMIPIPQLHHTGPRDEFPFQSLNREQAIQLKKILNPPRTKIPKFLIKRTEQQPGFQKHSKISQLPLGKSVTAQPTTDKQ